MVALGTGGGRPVVGLDLGPGLSAGCSQQIHEQLWAKFRLRRGEADVECG
jgi:hypothetical protein